ncbi:MAG TPA: lysophospholipid acyltransferase family protein [Candidatus Nanoarchaeia archaeon]|nr:lysophospholipid acyltransferase family protein [Candidatus Nanoarchaeia archaeon]
MVYSILKIWFPPLCKLWVSKIQGIENIPKNMPFIIAANHSSYYDDVLTYAIIVPQTNKQIHALVNSTYWKKFPAKQIIEHGKCIPVYVGKNYDADRNKKSLQLAVEYLKKGDLIMIFPEGTRSIDGKIKKGHSGVAKIALKSKTLVLPIGIKDSNKVLPKGAGFMKFARCSVIIGKPLSFENYNKNSYGKVTRIIMQKIAKLTGQEYNY